MKRKTFQYFLVLTIFFAFSCTSKKHITHDSYSVLDKEGMEFQLYSSLLHHTDLTSDSVQTYLKAAKTLTRKELGQYHIIDPCINKKDSVFTDIEMKVDRSFNHSDQLLKYKIDSCFIKDFIKQRIVEKYGDQYKL